MVWPEPCARSTSQSAHESRPELTLGHEKLKLVSASHAATRFVRTLGWVSIYLEFPYGFAMLNQCNLPSSMFIYCLLELLGFNLPSRQVSIYRPIVNEFQSTVYVNEFQSTVPSSMSFNLPSLSMSFNLPSHRQWLSIYRPPSMSFNLPSHRQWLSIYRPTVNEFQSTVPPSMSFNLPSHRQWVSIYRPIVK